MEACFSTRFEDVRHERSLIFLLPLTDLGILKQSKFIDHEINKIKNLALEKLHRQKCLIEYFALQILEYYFLFIKLPIIIEVRIQSC